ncbi:hypothetical protein SELMODRAFT_444654 [Selaginella moellendorffii]|uniref:Snurportin-1 n=1 Tax=Selaginella moellendorffii TaxID=88036 RepID=D8SBV6_SELML|nr:snurportin-1 isoform X1 [Selaginella moellendorffii]XP_024541705.1 snurportin-1 isoform X1 [Selaginella moellendorffii]EFJ17988.1 hypothetical protein SELMODRAFT_444654 [Selaginella moellendorffii]|eukprot:XP_024541704.1 snurportin-1 isoform X1 [Selaginella moellendorffii]
MAELRHRAHKKVISDQQRRRDVALDRQKQQRRDLQLHFRQLATALEDQRVVEEEEHEWGLAEGARLQGKDAKKWFSGQFMLPEWLIDIPLGLKSDWYVMARPAGKRCIVVSSRGTTVSRLRNGRVLHSFPSALPSGAKVSSGPIQGSSSFTILDCIFHEADETYYVLDIMCWRGYSLYDCNTEFRLFWRDSKIVETDALKPPSTHHRYRFSLLPVYECNAKGLEAAYREEQTFLRDGILFYNRHAHYTVGYTPLALLWKDSQCSQYLLDTDAKGEVPSLQQVVLELKSDGTVGTSDDPSVILGTMPRQVLEQNPTFLKPGTLLRFAIGTDGLKIVDGKPFAADINYQGPANKYRPCADSCTKILFQYAARHSPINISDIVAAIENQDVEMQ